MLTVDPMGEAILQKFSNKYASYDVVRPPEFGADKTFVHLVMWKT